MSALPPGSTIGVLGGGQLGRMMAVSAAQLGFQCHIYAPEQNSVAAEVSAKFTCAGYHDIEALQAFAKTCDVLTFEWENIPVSALNQLDGSTPLHPPIAALDIAQHRITEKQFACDQGGRTAPFAQANDLTALDSAIEHIGTPAILKTLRMGYDGKGQTRVKPGDDLTQHWQAVGEEPCIVEGFVNFSHEFSIILVRGQDGEIRYWDTPHNVHENGILAVSTAPAPTAILSQEDEARTLAAKMADAVDYVGVIACEFFATDDGPIFNEMAPRVHNSGHWTIEGAITSQFENHLRAICGLPLGDTGLAATKVEMHNLIGSQADNWEALLADDRNHLHLYGKGKSREGRKMGHVTRLFF